MSDTAFEKANKINEKLITNERRFGEMSDITDLVEEIAELYKNMVPVTVKPYELEKFKDYILMDVILMKCQALLTTHTVSKWISVEDSLPEPDQDVWAWFPDCIHMGAGFSYYMRTTGKDWHRVTHWMPLPEPPK